MSARFWLMALLSMMAIIALGVIYSAVNDPDVDRLNFFNIGSSDTVNETLIDQVQNTANEVVN